MPRIKGWERALLEEVKRHAALPFSWEQSNCVYFPMDCVKAITGADPWEEVRGICKSEDDFKRGMARYKFKNLGDAFGAKFSEIPLLNLSRGDIAVVEQDGELGGAVCINTYLVGKARTGMAYIPISLALRAFKVG